MKKSLFSFGRTTLFCAVLALSLPFVSCKQELEESYSLPPYKSLQLTQNAPVVGKYSTKNFSQYGMDDAYIFRPNFAYATASSAEILESVEGKIEGEDYFTVTETDYSNWPEVTSVSKYLNLKGTEKVYAVYNLLTGAVTTDGISDDEIDYYSGVIIFQAKYSPYGTPTVNCFYGVKFQFLTEDGKIPETTTKDTKYGKKIYIEGGYSSDKAYNNVATLEEAITKFSFNDANYFSESAWTESSSGAEQTSRSADKTIKIPENNIFVKE